MIISRLKGLVLGVALLFAACGSNPTEPGSNGQNNAAIDVILVSIPGGTFQMGQTGIAGLDDETGIAEPVHQVEISAFQMSAHEITNSQYATYLNAALASGEISVATHFVKGATGVYSDMEYFDLQNNDNRISFDSTSFNVVTGKEKLPVVAVTWYGAKAFATKYGFDLPSEAEWEYAARGGKQYEYGTNDGTIKSGNANFNSVDESPKNVGSYPPNPFGLYDLAGNVWEWCKDWHGSYSSDNAINPQGPVNGDERVLRGGGCSDNSGATCRSAFRVGFPPTVGTTLVGFRVVKR